MELCALDTESPCEVNAALHADRQPAAGARGPQHDEAVGSLGVVGGEGVEHHVALLRQLQTILYEGGRGSEIVTHFTQSTQGTFKLYLLL